MNEFTIGQRVRYVRPASQGGIEGLVGELGTVRNLFTGTDAVYVEFDGVPGGVWCKARSLANA